jgi:hypothetical protein
MKCRRLAQVNYGVTSYYDITGGKGLSNYATGDEAVLQTVRCELHLQLGEWFLDTTRGVPWLQNPNSAEPAILGRHPADLSYAEAQIKAAILRVVGVGVLYSFAINLNHATRVATCVVHGRLVSGTVFTLEESVL